MTGSSAQSKAIWPMPDFYFEVKWDDVAMSFQQVSGLDVESEPIEYRRGDSPVFSKIRMPGMVKNNSVTMKRGVFIGDNNLFNWLGEIQMNVIKKKDVTISLLDEKGTPTMVWTLQNAWPTKVTGTDLDAEGNDVGIERLEIAHEGLVVQTA